MASGTRSFDGRNKRTEISNSCMQHYRNIFYTKVLHAKKVCVSSVITYGTCLRYKRCAARIMIISSSRAQKSVSQLTSSPSLFDPSFLPMHRCRMMMTMPSREKRQSVVCRSLSYTITSPQSTRFGRHLLVSNSPSMLLGTVTSTGR